MRGTRARALMFAGETEPFFIQYAYSICVATRKQMMEKYGFQDASSPVSVLSDEFIFTVFFPCALLSTTLKMQLEFLIFVRVCVCV